MATDYCTSDEVKRYLSEIGVHAFADHDGDGIEDSGVVTDAIEWATDEINLFVLSGGRYELADLASNRLLGSWCVVLACCNLCQTRGNPVPDSLAMRCHKIMELLQKVRDGDLNLPEVPRQGQGVLLASNLHVDRRYRDEKVRVVRSTSTKKSSQLERDFADPGEYYD